MARSLVPAIRLISVVCLLATRPHAGLAQEGARDLKTGRDIFQAACAGCHGPDGSGAPDTQVGFTKPDTFPDFSGCDQSTPEREIDWRATILDGGRARAFSPIMPSFREALTSEQVDLVVRYLRGLCKDPKWPLGELNLPRPLQTEKAFPENEGILTTALNANGTGLVDQNITYEQRFGARYNIELALPYSLSKNTGRWMGGVGDVSIGLKRVMTASSRSGSIVSVQGEVKLPTGNRQLGFGKGVTVFEAFAAYDQILPKQAFLLFQAGGERPTNTRTAPSAVFWRAVAGKSLRQDGGVGRMWSPMTELLADRDLISGATTNWDIVPEMQVTLSRRQHIRANVGVKTPLNHRAGRSTQVVFYLLWDWFDGGFTKGWK
jgi:mono/diheme cytochrome c family protein